MAFFVNNRLQIPPGWPRQRLPAGVDQKQKGVAWLELLWTNQVKPVFPGLVNKVQEGERELLKAPLSGQLWGTFSNLQDNQKIALGNNNNTEEKNKNDLTAPSPLETAPNFALKTEKQFRLRWNFTLMSALIFGFPPRQTFLSRLSENFPLPISSPPPLYLSSWNWCPNSD